MHSLDHNDFKKLDSYSLALRIDAFFEEDYKNRYGHPKPMLNDVSAIEIYNSVLIQDLDDCKRKTALCLFYRSRFQRALSLQYYGFQNHFLDGSDSNNPLCLNSKMQVIFASTRQASIISSRIGFECLMEFVYFVENKRLISSKKSKLGNFRKWLCSSQNRFGWLIFYLVIVYEFNQRHRTPEVHGTSYIAIDALRCEDFSMPDSEFNAINLDLNIWRSILVTLNEGKSLPSCSLDVDYQELFQDFDNWQNINLEKIWDKYVKK
ncbi:hypothetical protein ACN4EG_07545 [Alkalinema pantanalense CENA528]|uniref:hypothetical protein n=1 Tax=Alkalinema pantanalense TaxID=1620705 RepID=UPI003D6DFEDE